MGLEHRLTLVSIVLTLGLSGCSRDEVEQDDARRRQLLAPQNVSAKAAQEREQARIFDAQGYLLASTERRGSVLLPRGYEATFSSESEWYYDGPAALPVLERFVREQIEVKSEKRHANGRVEFFASLPKGVEEPKPTYVSVYLQPGRPDRTRLEIHGYVKVPLDRRQQTEEEVQARMRERKKYAD